MEKEYDYQTQVKKLMTKEGFILILKIKANMDRLIRIAGAVRYAHAVDLSLLEGVGAADSWELRACVEFLVEIGHYHDIGSYTFIQLRG